jgi:6-phosphogluconolactonase/glucosamine-6-phosphate isomerase/deaminase
MHRLLSQKPFRSEIPWRDVHLCWVDDRMVPYDNPASNFGAAKKDFLEHVPIPSAHIHPMPTDIAPEQGAVRYQEALRALFNAEKGDFPSFDLVFLGIGQDGHTASLFPFEPGAIHCFLGFRQGKGVGSQGNPGEPTGGAAGPTCCADGGGDTDLASGPRCRLFAFRRDSP